MGGKGERKAAEVRFIYSCRCPPEKLDLFCVVSA
jgi:hypothetical protein